MRPFKTGTEWSLTALISMNISGRIGFVSLANVEYQPPPLPLFCFKWTCRHASFFYFLFCFFCIFMLYLCFKWTFRNARIVKGSSLYHRDLYSYYTNLNIITKLISFGQGTSKAALSTTEICIVNKTLHSKEICIVNKTLHSNLHSKYTLQGKVHIHYMLCICYTVDSKYTLSKQLN